MDFSDRIGKQNRPGYNAVSAVWEVVGEGEKETPLQKCRRLQCEMNELLEEISVLQGDAATSEDDKRSFEAVGEVVGASQKMLENLRLEQALGKDKTTGEAQKLMSQVAEFKKTAKLVAVPNCDESGQAARIAELDQRLYTLEKAVGAKPEQLSRLVGLQNVGSLIEGVQQLATKAALLQPNNLDLIEGRLQNLAAKMDAISSQKANLTSSDSSEGSGAKELKMKELYDIAKRTEPIAQTLPDVLSRMQALESLHKHANNFSKLIAELESTQSMITAGIAGNKKLLQQVQEVFAENLDNVNKEVAKLDERIKTLGK